jgi:hypothetical protein
VREGQALALIHHRGDPSAAAALIAGAYRIEDQAPAPPPLVIEVMREAS